MGLDKYALLQMGDYDELVRLTDVEYPNGDRLVEHPKGYISKKVPASRLTHVGGPQALKKYKHEIVPL